MKHLRLFLTHLLLFLTLWVGAFDTSYYSAAKGKKGEALKTALAGIIYTTKSVGYSGLKAAYETTDNKAGYIWDMYSNITHYPVGSAFASSYSKEGDGYNREHTIPQSIFNEDLPMKADLYHVYPTDAKINGIRDNNCHGEVGTSYTGSANDFSKWGAPSSSLRSKGCNETEVFEPNNEYKGDIARTYFYFVTCYQTLLSSFGSYGMFDKSTYPSFTNWAKLMLLEWSENDPVSTKETNRVEAVYNTTQHNRNPFIDYPGLEQYIWGSYTNVAFDPDNYQNPYNSTPPTPTPSITLSPTTASVVVGLTVTLTATIENANGATVNWTSSNSDVATVSGGVVTGVAAGTTTITATINVSGTPYSASCLISVTESGSGGNTSTDELTATILGLSSNYASVSGKTAISGTEYAAQAMTDGSSTYIQMRSNNNNSGIVSTSSVGNIGKVTVNWNGATSNGRTLNIYGKNTAYSSPSDLYNNSSQGTLLGTIVCGTSTELIVSGDYDFIGIRSNSGALYVNSIAIVWNISGTTPPEPVDPTIGFANSSVSLTVGDTYTQTPTYSGDGSISYTSSNTAVATVNPTSGEITAVGVGATTITATSTQTAAYNSATATYMVTVNAPAVPSISVMPSEVSIEKGCSVDLSATKENANAATITWSCTPSDVVSLSTTSGSSVTVTGLSAGSVIVTASIIVGGTTYADDCTVTVTSSGGSVSGDYYAKVTSNNDLTSGQYLIVYEDGNLAFDGGRSSLDAVGNTISVTIDNNQIEISSNIEAAEFTIDMSAGTVKSKSGYYIGQTSDANGLESSLSTVYTNTISYGNGSIDIKSSGDAYLRYNTSTNNGTRFRYYKSASYTNQQPIQLYKKVITETPPVLLGDVNKDDDITIADVTALVNIILGKDNGPEPLYNHDAAYVNEDDDITIADVTALVNIILGKTN